MNRGLNIAVVGATGAVGRVVVELLEERAFPVAELFLLASAKSKEQTIKFKNSNLEVTELDGFNFYDADIAIFSAGSEISKKYAPLAAAKNCIVIDNTSFFRNDPDIPLVIPEVNPHKIADYTKKNIIANPNCSTIQMLVALKPIHDLVGIKKICVATYQAVSGSGKKAVSELISQVGELLNGRPVTPEVYPQQIAFNVIPHIDDFLENGYTKEEMKMIWETHKIFEDDSIIINPTAVRVPVIYGHSEVINLELHNPLSVAQTITLLSKAPGVVVKNDSYPTALGDACGKDAVFVGRIRQELNSKLGLNLWVVADNVRKGAATNAIQIAEILYKDYL